MGVGGGERLFVGFRAVIVDEVHAFGVGDRGWHLLAVLERLTRIAGQPLQRIGLSATVGNPDELLRWLQGSSTGKRPGSVVGGNQGPFDMNALSNLTGQPTKPLGESAPELDLQLDYVGSTGVVFAEAEELIETVLASPRQVKPIGTD